MLGFLYTVPVTVGPLNDGKIDFSQLDVVAGAIAGAIVVLLVMLAIGYFLVKFKVVSVGATSITSPAQDVTNNMLTNLSEKLDDLKEEVKKYAEEHKRCEISLNDRFIPRHDLEKILDEIKGRQIRLREEVLPRDYVRQEQFKEMVKRIESIDDKLDTLISKFKTT